MRMRNSHQLISFHSAHKRNMTYVAFSQCFSPRPTHQTARDKQNLTLSHRWNPSPTVVVRFFIRYPFTLRPSLWYFTSRRYVCFYERKRIWGIQRGWKLANRSTSRVVGMHLTISSYKTTLFKTENYPLRRNRALSVFPPSQILVPPWSILRSTDFFLSLVVFFSYVWLHI